VVTENKKQASASFLEKSKNFCPRGRLRRCGNDASPSICYATRMSWPAPVELTGETVTLELLDPTHAAGLTEAVQDGELWSLWYTAIPAPEQMPQEIARRLKLHAEGKMLPFTVRARETGTILGMTTYMNIDSVHRRVEIGSTWYRASAQRSGVNTECKFLLLRHAFETLNCIAVEFRTHFFNQQSRRAIERLGAKQDGILRAHQLGPDGMLRDTVVYSIIAPEWPTVRRHLEFLRRRSGLEK
jgi:N-acetyltransferase